MRLVCSNKGFTLLETLITIGVFVILISAGSWFATTYLPLEQHRAALTTTDDALQLARTNTRSGIENTRWQVVFSEHAITVQTESGASQTVYELPAQSVLHWNDTHVRTFTEPHGFPDEPWTFSITTGSRTSQLTMNIYGILETQ